MIINYGKKKMCFLIILAVIVSSMFYSCNKSVSPELIKAYNESDELWYQYKFDEAKTNLEKVLNEDPSYANANRKMAFIEYRYYQNYKKALEYIQRAIKEQPKEVENHIILGDIYFANSQYENAIESYKNVLEIDSKNTKIYYLLAQSYIKINENDLAKKTLEKANSINPFHVKINNALHIEYVKDEEYDKAYNVWKNGNVSESKSLGYFNEWNELYKDAIEDKTAYDHAQLGDIYIELLLYDEAKLELEKALKDYPDDDEISNKLNEINLFVKFRDELKECWYEYYPKRNINGTREEISLRKEVEKIYEQMLVLFPDIDYNSFSFLQWHNYRLNNEIQEKFNVIINCFPIDGYLGCYFGYVVGDSIEEISQWGNKTDIRVTLIKNAVIDVYLNWYLNIDGMGGWSNTALDENGDVIYQNKIMIDSKYTMAYDLWEAATNKSKRDKVIDESQKSDKNLIEKPNLEVFYSSLLNYRFVFKAMDELIEEAKFKYDNEEEIKTYVINHLVYDVYIPLTYLHEGQHAIDAEHYNFQSWELEYRAKMSEPVYGDMQLLDITSQLKQDIGDESTAYGKAHTKIFTDIVNYIYNHKEDYPVIDTSKNIMMQLSKLSGNDLKEISKNIFEQEYPDEKYE